MYLFSFIIIPTVVLISFEKISPKKVYEMIVGLIISLVLSVVFWSLSTFYTPSSYTFLGKFIYIVFKEYLTLIAFTVYICIAIYKKIKMQSSYFVAGYFVSFLILSVALNYNSNSLFIIFLQPLLLAFYIYLYDIIGSWKFKRNDVLFKSLFIALVPIFLILLKQFYNSQIINFTIVFFLLLVGCIFIYLNKNRLFVKND